MSLQERQSLTLRGVFKALGPGILYAGAAIGASHLVLSTQAGANYSYNFIWAVLLINLFKYPFFEFSYRYTAATGKSMLDGYRKLGRWAIITFFLLSVITAIVNFAAVTKVTADLATYLFQVHLSPFATSTGLLSIILLMLFVGRYAFLDWFMKVMIGILVLFTITAFFFALSRGAQVEPGFVHPPLWDTAAIIFLIALMGWMPTPIDCSVWPSLWALERNKQTKYKPSFREYHIDFHIGYIGSAIMALFFLGLGALVMYGTGETFSANGVIFSEQLVSLYTTSIGSWSHSVIAVIVLITMFSTAITVIDGYPRSLEGSLHQMFPSLKMLGSGLYLFWIIFLSVTTVLIIVFFTRNMGSLLEFATILSFLTAPVFAIINYKVVTSKYIPDASQPRGLLKLLSWAGIGFLIVFSLIFLYYILL
ncbi:MAG: Nramp family divalent metal transporter [Bacteroidota bacterium]